MEKGCVLWGARVVIPRKQRHKLIGALHRNHPGIVEMKAVSLIYFWWPGLDKDIESLAKVVWIAKL